MSALSKSCYSHIHELRCFRPYLDFKTASTIAISVVHSNLDICNSLCFNLHNSKLNSLKLIQNYLARVIIRAPTFSHAILHWLKIKERINYQLLSLTYKVLTSTQPLYTAITLSLFSPLQHSFLFFCHHFSTILHLL